MKKLLTIISCACMAAYGELTFDYHENEQSVPLVTPELQAMAAQMFGAEQAAMLLHAVKLQMAKYDNDMRTPEGRRKWHGKLIGEIVDTNVMCKVSVYSNTVNGAIWRFREAFKPKGVAFPRGYVTYSTSGVPARLAAARARRNAELAQGVTVTNVVIETPPMSLPDEEQEEGATRHD